MVSEATDPRAGLNSDSCLTVAETAERLAAVGAHLSPEELARARVCAVEARGGLRMRLARDYLRLLDPLEAPHESADGAKALLASLARDTTVYESGALAFDLLAGLRRPAAAGQEG